MLPPGGHVQTKIEDLFVVTFPDGRKGVLHMGAHGFTSLEVKPESIEGHLVRQYKLTPEQAAKKAADAITAAAAIAKVRASYRIPDGTPAPAAEAIKAELQKRLAHALHLLGPDAPKA